MSLVVMVCGRHCRTPFRLTSAVTFVAAVRAVVFFVTAKFHGDTTAVVALKASIGTAGVGLLVGTGHARPVICHVDGHALRTAAVPLQQSTFRTDDETEV